VQYKQILHGDQTRCEDNFYMVDQKMLTRDLFAVANLLFSVSEVVACGRGRLR